MDQTRVAFLRDRSARSIAASAQVLNWRMPYVGFLLTGLGTLGCVIAGTASELAVIFLTYVCALVAFNLIERSRVKRALGILGGIVAETGPPPDPEATESLPRYMLAVNDASSVQALDGILVPRGDDAARIREELKHSRHAEAAYVLPTMLSMVGFVFSVILIPIGVFSGIGFSVLVSEITLVMLAVSPAFTFQSSLTSRGRLAQHINDVRMHLAEEALTNLPLPDPAFTDGIAIRFRVDHYIVDGKSLQTRSGSRSPRGGRPDLMVVVFFIFAPTLLAIVAFIIHPFSGILNR